MSEIIYPQIPHDEKKSIKLKYDDIEKIKHLFYVEKWNILQISDRFEVLPHAIRYHLDEEYKKKCIMASKKCKDKYRQDKNYNKKQQKYLKEWTKNRKQTDKNFKKHYNFLTSKSVKKWYKNNKDMVSKYNKKYYLNKRKIKRKIQYAMRWFDA